MTKRTLVVLAYTAGIAGAVFGFFLFVLWLFGDGPRLPHALDIVFLTAFLLMAVAGMALVGEGVAVVARRLFRPWLEPKWPPRKITRVRRAYLLVPMVVVFIVSCFLPELVSLATHLRYGSTFEIGSRRIRVPSTWMAGPWLWGREAVTEDDSYVEAFELRGRARCPSTSIWRILDAAPVAIATFSNSRMSHDISALRAYWASDGWTESRRVLASAGRELECWEFRSASRLKIFCGATQPDDRFSADFEIQSEYSRPYQRYVSSTASADLAVFYRMLESAEAVR